MAGLPLPEAMVTAEDVVEEQIVTCRIYRGRPAPRRLESSQHQAGSSSKPGAGWRASPVGVGINPSIWQRRGSGVGLPPRRGDRRPGR